MTALSGNRVAIHAPLQVLDMRCLGGSPRAQETRAEDMASPAVPRLTLSVPYGRAEAVVELPRNRLAAISRDDLGKHGCWVFDLGTGSTLQSLHGFYDPRMTVCYTSVTYGDGHMLVAEFLAVYYSRGSGRKTTSTLFVFGEEPDGKVGRVMRVSPA